MKAIYTALITPFNQQGQIDFNGLENVIAKLIREGERGFVVCGTTAEAPTLSLSEKEQILDFVIRQAKDCSIIMGISGNDTAEVLKQLKYFENKEVDALMVVVPYYNKPSQVGLFKHFDLLLSSTDKNIIIYNVPSRCGVEIKAETMLQLLKKHQNLIGLKHASQNFEMVTQIKAEYPHFLILSGEDGTLKEGLDHGMDGVISVSSHMIYPKLEQFMKDYEYQMNLELQDDFIKNFAQYVFIEASPGPIKYMLSIQGYIENVLRLPMCPVSKETEKKLKRLVNNL